MIKISRVYTFERFLQILTEKKISFVSPVLWEDPWEAILYQQTSENNVVNRNVSIWGSCWTTNQESDFAWKAYAPNKNGIIVNSSIRTVSAAIKETLSKDFTFVYKEVLYNRMKRFSQ